METGTARKLARSLSISLLSQTSFMKPRTSFTNYTVSRLFISTLLLFLS